MGGKKEVRPQFYNIYKRQIEMDQRIKCKRYNYKKIDANLCDMGLDDTFLSTIKK